MKKKIDFLKHFIFSNKNGNKNFLQYSIKKCSKAIR